MYTQKGHSLDNIDLRILCELQKNSRSPYRSIGNTLSISANTVRIRIDRMLQEGVIERFVLEVNPTRFNYTMVYLLIPGHEKNYSDDIINLIGEILFHASCIGQLNIFCVLVKEDKDLERKVHHLESLIKSVRVLGIESSKDTAKIGLMRMIETDYKIIETLVADPRANVDSIASRIHVAPRTVRRRLDKLIANKVLEFGILYNPTRFIGYIPFHILVHTDSNNLYRVLDYVSKEFEQYFFGYPEINPILNTIILDMYGASIYELEELYKKIRTSSGVKNADLLIPTKIRTSHEWLLNELKTRISKSQAQI